MSSRSAFLAASLHCVGLTCPHFEQALTRSIKLRFKLFFGKMNRKIDNNCRALLDLKRVERTLVIVRQ